MSRNRFEGWYFKHQAGDKSLALIPGRASDGAFVLVITDRGSYHIKYPLAEYHKCDTGKQPFRIQVGSNIFSPSGITLDIRRPGLHLQARFATLVLRPFAAI